MKRSIGRTAAALLAAYEEYCRELNAYAAALFAEKFEGIL